MSDHTPPLPVFASDHLLQQARWIRDILDPQVAQAGSDSLHSDDILTLDELLRDLLNYPLDVETMRRSRIHSAVQQIAGKATRWPSKLVERCDSLVSVWETQHGPLDLLKPPIYEPGGRLHAICRPGRTSSEQLLISWLKSPGAKLSPAISRKWGNLGFTPGDWWISPLFAHRAGIIDSANPEGGIVSDANGAYAIVMADGDEDSCLDPRIVQYRTPTRDPGRYRLTAGTPESRNPVRLLRSHTLNSLWRPMVGLRYDGLYVVTGWTISRKCKLSSVIYTITLKRIPNETSMDDVLRRPWSDEMDDYAEFKRQQLVE